MSGVKYIIYAFRDRFRDTPVSDRLVFCLLRALIFTNFNCNDMLESQNLRKSLNLQPQKTETT